MRRSSTAQAARAAVTLAGVYAVFGLTRTGAVLDESLRAGRDDTGTALTRLALDLLGTINPATLVAATAVLALLGWRRAGPRGAAAAAAAISLAVGTAESLKALLLPNMHHQGGSGVVLGGSFPSGHVTVATVLVLTALSTATPRTRRRLRGPAVVLPALTAVATVMAGWHRPSDAVAGVLTGILAHHTALAILHMDAGATAPDTNSESGRLAMRSGTRPAAARAPVSVRPPGAWSWTIAAVGCAAAVSSYRTGLPDSWSEPGLVAYIGALAAVLLAAHVLMAREVREVREVRA